MKHLSLKAILIAFIADLGLSQLPGVFLSIVMLATIPLPQTRALIANGGATRVVIFLSNSTPFIVWGLLFGCAGNVVGGWVASILSPLHFKSNARAAATVTALSSLLLMSFHPMWYRIVAILLTFPCYRLGALWATRRNTGKAGRQRSAIEPAPIAPPH